MKTVWRIFTSGFIIDARSLALMRMGVGVTLLLYLFFLIPDIHNFYSDTGVLPRTAPLLLHPWLFSFFLANGTSIFISILFCIQILLASMLLVGYKTRFVSFFSWLLYLSLINRNPLIVSAADHLLLLLLFIGIFLPWGKRFSIDSIRKNTTLKNNVLTLVTSLYVLHIMILYGFAGAFKVNPLWIEGKAILYMLSYVPYQKPLAHLLISFPPLTTFLNYSTIILELSIPLLIIFPFKNSFFRTIAIIGLVTFHTGIGITQDLGLFSIIAIVGISGLLPSFAWKYIEKNRYFTMAKNTVLSRYSPKLSSQTDGQFFPKNNIFSLISSLFLFVIILCVLALNITTLFSLGPRYENTIAFPSYFFRLTQWDMYSKAATSQKWITIIGTSPDGGKYNLLRNTSTINFHQSFDTWAYKNHRWKKYMQLIDQEDVVSPFSIYVCREWNKHNPHRQMKQITIYISQAPIIPSGIIQPPSTRRIFTRSCL